MMPVLSLQQEIKRQISIAVENKLIETLLWATYLLSAFNEPGNGDSVGKHPLVSDLIAGILNKHFPQPRYTFIWDVDTVVKYLSSSVQPKHATFSL